MITGVIFSVPERDCRELVADARRLVDDLYIIDDPRTMGKKLFWKRMREAISYCLSGNNDWFVIMPDDIKLTRPESIVSVLEALDEYQYCINLINDGRARCWNARPYSDLNVTVAGEALIHVDYCDCGFITNRRTMEAIEINPVAGGWFNRPGKSSGVGAQITKSLRTHRIPMYCPERSFVYHGCHESIMHPEERKKTPIISL